jgi:hypothetical protein
VVELLGIFFVIIFHFLVGLKTGKDRETKYLFAKCSGEINIYLSIWNWLFGSTFNLNGE